jgi:hypothetical protein
MNKLNLDDLIENSDRSAAGLAILHQRARPILVLTPLAFLVGLVCVIVGTFVAPAGSSFRELLALGAFLSAALVVIGVIAGFVTLATFFAVMELWLMNAVDQESTTREENEVLLGVFESVVARSPMIADQVLHEKALEIRLSATPDLKEELESRVRDRIEHATQQSFAV